MRSPRYLQVYLGSYLYSNVSIVFRAEYGAFWKCVTAGLVYMITQLMKMLFLATFFPTSDDDDDDANFDKEIPFDAITVRKHGIIPLYYARGSKITSSPTPN